MDNIDIKTKYESYVRDKRDIEKEKRVWKEQSTMFHDFWTDKIMNSAYPELGTSDIEPIIRMLDDRARGFNPKIDMAVSRCNIYQGTWMRMFQDMKNKDALRSCMDKILATSNRDELSGLIDELEHINAKNKNGLTGWGGNALNAILYLNRPEKFISMVSGRHRWMVIDAFGFDKTADYEKFSARIINAQDDLVKGFSALLSIDIDDNAFMHRKFLSGFLYDTDIKSQWRKHALADQEPIPEDELEHEEFQSAFAMERHLEDFLIANWEKSALGESYDLLEDRGEMISQQFNTREIGIIDILAKEKEGKKRYIVIELKKDQTTDKTVGQLTRYMGWVQKNLANGEEVLGLIIAKGGDARLRYALGAVPNVDLWTYSVEFSLDPAPK